MTPATAQPVARSLFVATILFGSFLLFLVQPMVARMALPRLGGAPNVWNSAMIVYQLLLLAGYAYAHRLASVARMRPSLVHLGLMALFALTLPLALYPLSAPAAGWEVLWVPLLLVLTVGPVFFIVSAQAPLMQRWYAIHPKSGEPWALYAASNLGSFAGLIAYPLLFEPNFSLAGQSRAWSIGYLVLLALVGACAWTRRRNPENRPVGRPAAAPLLSEAPPPGWRTVFLWVGLSAVPSGLMLSSTTHLTTDIVAVPMLWVIPLGLYLLSFVVAFADNRTAAWAITWFAPVTMLAAGGLAMASRHSGNLTVALASIALLFMVAVSLHSRLYDLRPERSRLTLFYLVMAIGGAIGGAFTAIVAPVVFDWVWEHPILVLLAALLMPLPVPFRWDRLQGLDPPVKWLACAVFLGTAAFLAWLLHDANTYAEPPGFVTFLQAGLVVIGILLLPFRWMFFSVLVMLMLAQGGVETFRTTLHGDRSRSYFGIYTVTESRERKVRMLVHGTTLHGQQSTDPAHRLDPSTYYGPRSGAALALRQAPVLYGTNARIGVVGLGTGTLACNREDGQSWTFFELDPKVLEFSRNRTFTYLEDCAPGAHVVLGDARLELAKVRPASFDMLAIDAFSSDAIPLHLLTSEAMSVYFRALVDDGVAIVHISNRYIELEPVLAAIAREQGLHARQRRDDPGESAVLTGSVWVALSRDPKKLSELAEAVPDAPWEALGAPAESVWTDDYASILPFVQWNKLLRTL